MRKIFLVCLMVVAATVALVAFAGDIPETMTIDDCAKKKAPVEFPHKAHFEFAACVDCHHTSEGLTLETAAEMEVASCGSCHVEPEKAETPLCSSGKKDNPYHISCTGCHKTYKKEHADTTAPTKCAGCHPKPAK